MLALFIIVGLIVFAPPFTSASAGPMVGTPVAPQIEAGDNHTCALLANGTVQCWGQDTTGQLGNDSTLSNRTSPVPVTGITGADASTTATAIAAGSSHTCALLANGTVQCWGADDSGQLGDDTSFANSPTPVPVAGITGVDASTTAIAITAGYGQTCALLVNGSLLCWGSDGEGQLGNDTNLTNSPTPVPVAGIDTAIAVAAGNYHTCALLGDGTIQCWGADSYGQLGNDPNLTNQPTPVPVTGITTATVIAAGGFHTCAVLALNGTARCWGYAEYGQLGDGTIGTPSNSPTPIDVMNLTTATAIAAGYEHTCARLANGTVQCWGRGNQGQLGNGLPGNNSTAPLPVAGISTATAITTGGHHTCVLLAIGVVQCWGDDFAGQLGNGDPTDDSFSPVATLLVPAIRPTAVTAGRSHTCALISTGIVKCWGADSEGQLGNDTALTASPTPVTVAGISTAIAIASGNDHTCALLAGGTVQCWGQDDSGQLGDGTAGNDSPTPVSVSGVSNAVAIAAGGAHTCALLADGLAYCWGLDVRGQLGDGIANNPQLDAVPSMVVTIANITAISAGDSHTCARLTDGTLWCWGYDIAGQLGDGTTGTPDNNPAPVSVSSITTATAVAAGSFHTCAGLVNGTLRCWGRDNRGQLGDGTIADPEFMPTPVIVSNINTATIVATGSSHTCAQLADGTVQCWGFDNNGQLGNDATIANSPVPVTVSNITTATTIATGYYHTCAVLADGAVQCWGDDSDYQLGNDSSILNSPIPVAVRNLVANVFLPVLMR